MVDLAGRPPLGPKAGKPPKKARKPLPKQSKRRKAYLASDARKHGLERMERLHQCPCLICGAWGIEVHHLPDPRDDMRTIALCPRHHRREYGPDAYHYARRAFNDLHGSDDELLARQNAILASM